MSRMKRIMTGIAFGMLLAGLPGGCPLTGTEVGAGGGAPQLLTGVWRADFIDPTFGPGTVELILMANGQFQQQTAYAAGSLVTLFGSYRVFTNEALLRLDIARGEPAQACGPLGCTNIIYPAGESYGYTLTGPGALTLQNLNCVPGTSGVCVFNYARVN